MFVPNHESWSLLCTWKWMEGDEEQEEEEEAGGGLHQWRGRHWGTEEKWKRNWWCLWSWVEFGWKCLPIYARWERMEPKTSANDVMTYYYSKTSWKRQANNENIQPPTQSQPHRKHSTPMMYRFLWSPKRVDQISETTSNTWKSTSHKMLFKRSSSRTMEECVDKCARKNLKNRASRE